MCGGVGRGGGDLEAINDFTPHTQRSEWEANNLNTREGPGLLSTRSILPVSVFFPRSHALFLTFLEHRVGDAIQSNG